MVEHVWRRSGCSTGCGGHSLRKQSARVRGDVSAVVYDVASGGRGARGCSLQLKAVDAVRVRPERAGRAQGASLPPQIAAGLYCCRRAPVSVARRHVSTSQPSSRRKGCCGHGTASTRTYTARVTIAARGRGLSAEAVKRRFTQAADFAAANPCDMYRGELKTYNKKIEHKSSPLEGSCSRCCCNSSQKRLIYAQYFHYKFLILHDTCHMQKRLRPMRIV